MENSNKSDALKVLLKKIKYCAVIQSYLIQKSLTSDDVIDVENVFRDIQRLSDYIKNLSDTLLATGNNTADDVFFGVDFDMKSGGYLELGGGSRGGDGNEKGYDDKGGHNTLPVMLDKNDDNNNYNSDNTNNDNNDNDNNNN